MALGARATVAGGKDEPSHEDHQKWVGRGADSHTCQSNEADVRTAIPSRGQNSALWSEVLNLGRFDADAGRHIVTVEEHFNVHGYADAIAFSQRLDSES
ncbi:MAG: hypothetical protein NTNFB02_31000 [Nitrospira sp.]